MQEPEPIDHTEGWAIEDFAESLSLHLDESDPWAYSPDDDESVPSRLPLDAHPDILELPEEMRGRYSEFPGRRSVVRVTVDRQLAVNNPDLAPMDFASVFFRDLIEKAKSPEFKGEYASIRGPEGGALGLFKIRWQNDQGVPKWEALVPIFLSQGQNQPVANPPFFGSLLYESAQGEAHWDAVNAKERGQSINRLVNRAHVELANRCTALRHPNDVVLLAAADLMPA